MRALSWSSEAARPEPVEGSFFFGRARFPSGRSGEQVGVAPPESAASAARSSSRPSRYLRKRTRGLLGVVELGVRRLPSEDVVDVFEGLFEHEGPRAMRC